MVTGIGDWALPAVTATARVVDLERRRPIELLPERAASLAVLREGWQPDRGSRRSHRRLDAQRNSPAPRRGDAPLVGNPVVSRFVTTQPGANCTAAGHGGGHAERLSPYCAIGAELERPQRRSGCQRRRVGTRSRLYTGAEPARLFASLAVTLFFVFSLICLTVGPISAESVPATLMSTASGIVIGVGEIFGGGVAPASPTSIRTTWSACLTCG